MNTIAELNKMIEELHTVADALEPLLPAVDIAFFIDFIDNNEVGVGLDMILSQIYEYDVTIPKWTYDILKKAGKRAKLDDRYFEGLKYSEP